LRSGRSRCRGRRRRSLIHGPRTSLRHDDAARRWRRRTGLHNWSWWFGHRSDRRWCGRSAGNLRFGSGRRGRRDSRAIWRRSHSDYTAGRWCGDHGRLRRHRRRRGRLYFNSSYGRLGHNRTSRRLRGNRRGRWRCDYDTGLLPGLRNNPPRGNRRLCAWPQSLSRGTRSARSGPDLARSTQANSRGRRSVGNSRWLRRSAGGSLHRGRLSSWPCLGWRCLRRSGGALGRRGNGGSRRAYRGIACCGPECGRCGRTLRRSGSFFLPLLNGLQNVAGLGNTRPVDLLLGFAALRAGRRGAVSAATLEISAHTLGFVFFERAGMRLLLGHADVRQGIQDCPALYFQFAC
jgi:hypothetical protein